MVHIDFAEKKSMDNTNTHTHTHSFHKITSDKFGERKMEANLA